MALVGPLEPDQAIEAHARRRVQEIRGFYLHAGIYVLVNIGLLLVYIFGPGGGFWPIWCILGWGAGLGIHALSAWRMVPTLFTREWEDKKVRQIIAHEKKVIENAARRGK